MNLTEICTLSDCRSKLAGSQSMRCVVKVRYQAVATGYPDDLSGTERVRSTGKATKKTMNTPTRPSLIGWHVPLIPIAPPPLQTRVSNPAVSYMSFSATPAR